MRKKNTETPNTNALMRTSSYREERENYLDEKEQRYVYIKKSSDRKMPDTHEYIVLGQIYENPDGTKGVIDEEILIVLDGIDHEECVGDEIEERYRDKVFAEKETKYERSGGTDENVKDPWNTVAAPNTDPFALLYKEERPVGERIQRVLEFMDTLTEKERDLIYDHLGSSRFLEDIRHEEEALTGKQVTQQAFSKRWNKIIAKGCAYFGVEKPRKRKK